MLKFEFGPSYFEVFQDRENNKFTYTEHEGKKLKTYAGAVIIDLDDVNLDNEAEFKAYLSPKNIEILNRIAQYGQKIIFFSNAADLNPHKKALESLKNAFSNSDRTFPNYSVCQTARVSHVPGFPALDANNPSSNSSAPAPSASQGSSAVLLRGSDQELLDRNPNPSINPSSTRTSQSNHLPELSECYLVSNGTANFDFFSTYAPKHKSLSDILSECRTKPLIDNARELSRSQYFYLLAIENYLAWRGDKHMPEDSRPTQYKLGLFTKLRHWTDFGKNRAEGLRARIIAAKDTGELNQVITEHFSKDSNLGNHSLDTYMLETAARAKGGNIKLSTEKERTDFRSMILQELNPPRPVASPGQTTGTVTG